MFSYGRSHFGRFDKVEFNIDQITSIQRKTSFKTWVVLFNTLLVKKEGLDLSSTQINGIIVFISDCENRLALVKIYKSPKDVLDTALISRLSCYGKVISFRRPSS